MPFNEHTTPDKLERYSFLWSEVRLVIAALALFLGGVPPIFLLISGPGLYGLVRTLLTLSWIISGLASAYLIYRWSQHGQRLFGAKAQMDLAAFLVMIISGFNLGLTGLLGKNIGMSVASGKYVFILVGVLYLVAAWHLYQRWHASHQKLL